jgi:hypothetical protein
MKLGKNAKWIGLYSKMEWNSQILIAFAFNTLQALDLTHKELTG